MQDVDIIAGYHRKISSAIAAMPDYRPWVEDDRNTLSRIARAPLGIRDDWIPEIRFQTVRVTAISDVSVESLRFESWENTHGAALKYSPESPTGAAVLLCCGHGDGGKFHAAYRSMARRLVRRGVTVIVPDNIGQGERAAMGHADCAAPFYCNTSVQGLIVMESMAWLNAMRSDPVIDPDRIAVIGNSGGGTLAMFLGALSNGLAAVSSSGYPSTFEYIARKEKTHCYCNIIPGIVGALEMWMLFGLIAPAPLLIFQGRYDNLFPEDIFYSMARRVADVYSRMAAPDAFYAEVTSGTHPWDAEKETRLADFLTEPLGLTAEYDSDAGTVDLDGELSLIGACLDSWPDSALTTAELASKITGVSVPEAITLQDIFPPEHGAFSDAYPPLRTGVRQLASQMEAFLHRDGSGDLTMAV